MKPGCSHYFVGVTGRKHPFFVKRIAILQSNYIPWKGYFDIINSVDEFVIYDEAQYTRRDWRNRNLIKTRNGLIWLTIPVKTKSRFSQKICDTEINGNSWCDKHFDSIRHNYTNTKYFKEFAEIIMNAYHESKSLKYLSDVNKLFLDIILSILNIKTKISCSSEFNYSGNSTEKIISICRQAGASEYLTGQAAKSYLDEERVRKSGIRLLWMDYSGYPEYEQLYPPFEHRVSILDLIFNMGTEARNFMKSF